jgi:capsular polysaccharide biosynthesis protein
MAARAGAFKGRDEIDIGLYSDVLRRHRTVVIVGVVLTLIFAVLSFVRLSPSGISYRSPAIWGNQATLVLTQEGAPELRSVLPSGPGGFSTSLADTGRFASLIDVYATLATSDAVVRELKRRGLLKPEDLKDGALPIAAAAVPSTVNASTPMMTLSATGPSASSATALTLGATNAFLDVLHARQNAAKIPVKDRIQVRVVKSSETPKLVSPRSKALPIIVLLGGLIATAAVAFTRDNVSRRGRAGQLGASASHDEHDESEIVPRSPLEPVRRPEAQAKHDEPSTSISVARGRSTLGSVPRGDAARSHEREIPDEVAEQARRR